MALITGTSGNDKLRGSRAQDTLIANGGSDVLIGKGGSDNYQLYFNNTASAIRPNYVINETNGGDASVDRITGVGSLVQYNTATGLDYASFRRTGPDGQHLVIETATKANFWNVTGVEGGTIKIINQYSASAPDAHVEIYSAGGVDYNLLNTDTGTATADIMTGWKFADTLNAGAGNDFISGGGGRDTIHGGEGNDIIFGDRGGDFLYGDLGNDTIFGSAANDKIYGGADNDQLHGGDGRDVLRGGAGDDALNGGTNIDWLFGGSGNDTLDGGAGDDKLIGNKGYDTYVVSSLGSGNDTIIENGRAPLVQAIPFIYTQDTIQIDDYASWDAARHGVSFGVSGNDLVLDYTNEAAPAVTSQLTVQNQFLSGKYAIEHISLGDFGGITIQGGVFSGTVIPNGLFHVAYLSGDNFTFSVHNGNDAGGNDIVFGSAGNDQIYGGIGQDIMIGAGGADQFMFHDEGPGGSGGDIIQDFNLADDILDFSEMAGTTFADMTITDNAHGNAVISHSQGAIELWGITTAEIDAGIFNFL